MKVCNFVCQLAMHRALEHHVHHEELAENRYCRIYMWSEAGCSYSLG